MDMEENIADFDAYLAERGLAFSGIVVGGASLILSGAVNRATDDVDIIAPEPPMARSRGTLAAKAST